LSDAAFFLVADGSASISLLFGTRIRKKEEGELENLNIELAFYVG
jgi:hypothetical protein